MPRLKEGGELGNESISQESSGPSSELKKQRSSELEQPESRDGLSEGRVDPSDSDRKSPKEVGDKDSREPLREEPLPNETGREPKPEAEKGTLDQQQPRNEELNLNEAERNKPLGTETEKPMAKNGEDAPLDIDTPENTNPDAKNNAKPENQGEKRNDAGENGKPLEAGDSAGDTKKLEDPSKDDELTKRREGEEQARVQSGEADQKDKPLELPDESKTEKKQDSQDTDDKSKVGERVANNHDNPNGLKNLEDGKTVYSYDKAKFNGKDFDRLEKAAGDSAYKEAYAKALKEKKPESVARQEADAAMKRAIKALDKLGVSLRA